MRRAMMAMIAALAAGPAGAATIILLPAPGSMQSVRIFVGNGDPDDIYVCSLSEPGGGRCSLHRAHSRSR